MTIAELKTWFVAGKALSTTDDGQPVLYVCGHMETAGRLLCADCVTANQEKVFAAIQNNTPEWQVTTLIVNEHHLPCNCPTHR